MLAYGKRRPEPKTSLACSNSRSRRRPWPTRLRCEPQRRAARPRSPVPSRRRRHHSRRNARAPTGAYRCVPRPPHGKAATAPLACFRPTGPPWRSRWLVPCLPSWNPSACAINPANVPLPRGIAHACAPARIPGDLVGRNLTGVRFQPSRAWPRPRARVLPTDRPTQCRLPPTPRDRSLATGDPRT